MEHDCLPTCHQLQYRHIPADDRCVFCGKMEQVEHLFARCLEETASAAPPACDGMHRQAGAAAPGTSAAILRGKDGVVSGG
jgi:hypothetical protein